MEIREVALDESSGPASTFLDGCIFNVVVEGLRSCAAIYGSEAASEMGLQSHLGLFI